jgi:GAF domain-containing protein
MNEATPDASECRLAEGLRRLVRAIEASGRAILPSSDDELLQTVVEAAARLFGAAASSIALVDDAEQMLQFRVATGAGSGEVVGMRIPIDEGIAGYVAMTGQPIAVSSVQEDPRFARETAKKTGYVPRSILAMPLVCDDRVIGVIEVLDKINAPSFGMQDMELLGIFARQAAIAIRASQHYQHLGEALLGSIRRLAQEDTSAEMQEVQQVLAETAEAPEGTDEIMALADIFGSIGKLGEAERKACLQILSAFSDYAHSRPRYA